MSDAAKILPRWASAADLRHIRKLCAKALKSRQQAKKRPLTADTLMWSPRRGFHVVPALKSRTKGKAAK